MSSDTNTNVTKFKELFNSSGEKIGDFFTFLSTIFIRILDKTVNGFKIKDNPHKYYTYFISIVLILILCLFYYLNEKQNLFAIKNSKYEILVTIVLLGFSIYCFLFFVYRNHTLWDDPGKRDTDNKHNSDTAYADIYNENSRKIIDIKDDNSATINKPNLKATLTSPLFNVMKYFFYLLLLISLPLFLLNYTFYLHKVNDNLLNITKNILLLLIFLIVLAIIAKLFSIKTSSNGSIYCEIEIEKDKKPAYTDLIKSYAKYFLCIFKNFVFFIPCLIVILTDEINNDIRLTPSSVYILFFILLLLVLSLIFLPMLFKFIRTFNKSDILQGSGPFYLNEEKTLGKYQNLNTHLSKPITVPNITVEEDKKPNEERLDKIMDAFNMDKDAYKKQLNSFNSSIGIDKGTSSDSGSIKDASANSSNIKTHSFTLFNDVNSAFNIKTTYSNSIVSKEKFPYNYTYSLSFYIYLNPQPENTSLAYTKDTVLFNYGFKPVIYYNGSSQKIIIKSRTISNRGDQLDTIYEMINPKFQKWLFFVINYDNNMIDVFIDGKLVGSKEDVSPYFKGDAITIGERDGIHGSIKEIYYYNKVRTPSTIELLYNLSKNNT
uniref:Uncharacterized protein n=1 Tax=viral metagenome TaxID=1070528 RepID=A0A6C0KSC2_9ZZZZ